MTVYVYEDKEDSTLSKFFLTGYKPTSHILYARGCDNIFNTISKESTISTETRIMIVMDLVFDNNESVSSYTKLVYNLVKHGYNNFMIFPIVCTEYYFIKLLFELGLLDTSTLVDVCINIDAYRNIDIQNPSIASSKNFENFCKEVLYHLGPKCTNKQQSEEFYKGDCLCCTPMTICKPITQEQKVLEFIKRFPCHPPGTIQRIGRRMTRKAMISLHERLIDEYNKNVRKNRAAERDPVRARKKYIEADYIHVLVKRFKNLEKDR